MRNYNLNDNERLKRICRMIFAIYCGIVLLLTHDPSQRANGFLTLAGGIVITFTKEILDIIVG